MHEQRIILNSRLAECYHLAESPRAISPELKKPLNRHDAKGAKDTKL